jgi:hypothetical protein
VAPGTYRPNDSSRNRTDHDEPKLISQPVGERKCFFPLSSREHDLAGLRKNAGHLGPHLRVIIHDKHHPHARRGAGPLLICPSLAVASAAPASLAPSESPSVAARLPGAGALDRSRNVALSWADGSRLTPLS